MKQTLMGVVGTLAALALFGFAWLQAGLIDVSADTPHSEPVYRLIEWARGRAIARAAAGIVAPPDLASPERIRRGAGNYDAMCVFCHLAPGMADSEIRRGLSPRPPNLAERAGDEALAGQAAARRFWVVKHGIKASGMPAWGKAGVEDEAVWNLVAFLDALPGLTPQQYRQQVAQSPGHSHRQAESAATPRDAGHDHAAHDHAH